MFFAFNKSGVRAFSLKKNRSRARWKQKHKAPHLRSSLSGGPAAPTGPRPPGRAPPQMQQREWRWARPTSSSSRFPQASSQHLVATLYSRPPTLSPSVWSYELDNPSPPGVVKEEKTPSQPRRSFSASPTKERLVGRRR
jgi:hypothetical protein